MRVVVIGGGFVGQLVQLAIPDARVLDWRKVAPVNYLETRQGPQYLWEPIPGVRSTEFEVTTLVDDEPPTPETVLAYKTKIGKDDDGGDWGLQFQHKMKGYASAMPVPRIEYNQQVRMVDLLGKTLGMSDWSTIKFDVLVSTIPLPSFLDLMIVGPTYQFPFRYDPIYMTVVPQTDHVEGMVLNYCSKADDPVYRRTLNGRDMFMESLAQIPDSRRIMPGKIHAHWENETILAQLSAYECFCFGRFATWRPDELAHQTWAAIEEWKGVVV